MKNPDKYVPKTIDEYISCFPTDIAAKLEAIRQAVAKAAPMAKEKISYGMPAFDFHGILVYFAAFRDHLSFFPTSSGVAAFSKELENFRTSKGTIQIPLNIPLPVDLIDRITKYRLSENTQKHEAKFQKNKTLPI
jgi:uncharacterized protein YdhG (YjbR/CyaY superfamily)